MDRLAVLISSFTIFALELAAAKALLPDFGGSYLVWGTALIFFQTALFAGYAGVRWLSSLLGPRGLTMVHAISLPASLLLLPLAMVRPQAAASQHLSIFVSLALSMGPAFVLLSTTSPMVQFWSSMRRGRESYSLFSWSNTGSLGGLLAYPLILERTTGLHGQFRLFTLLYCLWAALMLPMAISFLRSEREQQDSTAQEMAANGSSQPSAAPAAEASAEPQRQELTGARLLWFLSPVAANAMMLTVTNLLVWDMVSIPMMWVIPLAIFLVTFILNFSEKPFYPAWMDRLFHLSLTAMLLVYMAGRLDFDIQAIPLRLTYLTALFAICMKCQRLLYQARPARTGDLFGYYSAMALGGIAGTVLISLILPLASNSLTEVPISIALVALVTLFRDPDKPLQGSHWSGGMALAALLGLLLLWAHRPEADQAHKMALSGGALCFLGLMLGRRRECRVPVAVGAALFLVISTLAGLQGSMGRQVLMQVRNFYGIHKVLARGDQRILQHGSTFHGRQYQEGPKVGTPLSYYHSTTPLGRVFALKDISLDSCGLIGLGTGALATYQKAGQQWIWFELDQQVLDIARKWFSYLSLARGKIDFRIGDARITLRDVPNQEFNLLNVDAFSGDSIPVHLLTREAMQEFWSKCRGDGVILYHISSRYFNLEPVLAAAASSLGLKSMILIAEDNVDSDADPCRGLAVFTDPAWEQRLKFLGYRDTNAFPRPWTDDYASILDVLSL